MKKINKNIVMDMSATALVTGMALYTIFGKPANKYSIDINNKDGFDVTGFLHSTAKSIDDFFQETFSRDNAKSEIDVTFNGPRINAPVYPTKAFSKREIRNILGDGVYKRVTFKKINKKHSSVLENRLEKVFPAIYTTYNSLQPEEPISLEFLVALFRGESELDPKAKSYSNVIGLAQATRKTFVSYLPQFEHLLDYSYSNKIEKLDNLREDKVLSAHVGTKYVEDIHRFLMKNDPSYKFLSEKEQQKKIVVTYNVGEDMFSNAGFDIERLPVTPKRNYRKDARDLSNRVLYWMYGDDKYASNDTKSFGNSKRTSNKISHSKENDYTKKIVIDNKKAYKNKI